MKNKLAYRVLKVCNSTEEREVSVFIEDNKRIKAAFDFVKAIKGKTPMFILVTPKGGINILSNFVYSKFSRRYVKRLATIDGEISENICHLEVKGTWD